MVAVGHTISTFDNASTQTSDMAFFGETISGAYETYTGTETEIGTSSGDGINTKNMFTDFPSQTPIKSAREK